MEFMNRGTQPVQSTSNVPSSGEQAPAPRGKSGKGFGSFRSMRFVTAILLISSTVLVLLVLGYILVGKPVSKTEARYIDGSKMQAVFLNGGQVYFGKIRDLNQQYLHMSDIFYLRVNQVVQPNQGAQQAQNDISLVKLGCELHRPSNDMVINREQVIFWENLKDESGENTVPGAVKKYLAQYPNGQDCQNPQAQSTTPAATPTTNKPATTTPAR